MIMKKDAAASFFVREKISHRALRFRVGRNVVGERGRKEVR